MTTPVLPLLAQHIHDALFELRCARHWSDCRCGAYKKLWCTAQEQVAQQSLDRLLDRVPR